MGIFMKDIPSNKPNNYTIIFEQQVMYFKTSCDFYHFVKPIDVAHDMPFAVYVMAYYHPPTKLREGNVFSRVCLSTGVEEEG